MGAICCHGNQSSDPTWLVMIGLVVLEIFKFENVDGRTDAGSTTIL